MEKAQELANRFIAGIVKSAQPRATQDEKDLNPAVYDGPPRTAEQVTA